MDERNKRGGGGPRNPGGGGRDGRRPGGQGQGGGRPERQGRDGGRGRQDAAGKAPRPPRPEGGGQRDQRSGQRDQRGAQPDQRGGQRDQREGRRDERTQEDRRGRSHFRPEGERKRPPRRRDDKAAKATPARRHPTVEVRGSGRAGAGQQEAQHWIYGRHAVLAALANPRRRVQRLLATPQMLEEAALGKHSLLETMSRSEMDEVLARYDREGANHGGIAAYASTLNPLSAEALLKPEGRAVVVVLDQVSDPHNVGAVLRTAAAFGARAVIAPERNAAPVTGALAKAASGALETVPYLRPTNLARALAMLKEWGYWRIGLDGAATKSLDEAKAFERVALVLGAEGKGLRRLTAENCDLLVGIPMSEAVESLNVSNAAAIALYELSRRS